MNSSSNAAPLLLPAPRHLNLQGSQFIHPDSGVILINAPEPQDIFFSAVLLQGGLTDQWRIAAGGGAGEGKGIIALNLVPGGVQHEQGYQLIISEERIDLIASQPVGIFYGVQTLRQLVELSDGSLPTMNCRDWPDFPNRGVMLDISRDKVPTMSTLFELVDLLASWKVNQLQLYTEHTFAYTEHETVWEEASPMTGEEILELDAYCRKRFVELVPNQNSFGHMRRWLTHAEYVHLAECPDGFVTLWGEVHDEPFSLDPTNPESLNLVSGLYDELLPHFSSRQINIGCDETFELGQGKNEELVERVGGGRVYLDFLLKIYADLKSRGHTLQFWGDILMNHPELVPELPRDLIALEWGYEASHPFDAHCAIFAASCVPFYVCPGTSSWNTLAGRTDNALENLRSAAESGLKHGAVGYLNTDWGDSGHWQPLPVSFLGFGYGAGVSWAYEANRDIDIVSAASKFAFGDESNVMGKLAYELGNLYLESELQPPNNSILFRILQSAPEDLAIHANEADLRVTECRNILEHIAEIMEPLSESAIQREDADLILAEFTWLADMLRHSCGRLMWALELARGEEDPSLVEELVADADDLMARFKSIWHARNRPGGFKDSLARMEQMRSHYS
ncbi:MAG: family 20 glycosylhydrolase [Anaerolineales bacterium]|nr:family 20 glycosylhydrolase [Chloroflexota bacterium]MBL6983324.1 family 20 glycosylhydrolase [Anaerolineales bacterium]